MAAKVPESRIKKHFCDFQDQDGKVCGAGPYDIAHVGIHKRVAHGIIGKNSHRSRRSKPKPETALAPKGPEEIAQLIRKTQAETGLSIRKTARLLGIPKSTAERHMAISKKRPAEPITENTKTSDIPRNPKSHYYHCPHPGCMVRYPSRAGLGAHRKAMHNFAGTSYAVVHKREKKVELDSQIKKGELEYGFNDSGNRTHEEKISDLTVAIGFARCEFIIKELALTHHCLYRELTARIAELLQHTAMR